MNIKPTLCCDYEESKIRFPILCMVKIDGVRGINLEGTLTGRSLKKHANKHTTAMFSKPQFQGIDGELAADVWTSSSLCRDTTSAVNRIEGTPTITWWAFDYITEATVDLPYCERLRMLTAHVESINEPSVKVVPHVVVNSLEELNAFEEDALVQGFEGVILRDILGKVKSGRATVREGSYMRIKRFTDAEAICLEIQEAMQNNNQKVVNALGLSERSSHQENMTPKGMVGSLVCKCCETGETIVVGAGDMDHAMRKHYFDNQDEIVGKIVKYKSFRHGVKSKPRFPTFLSIRAESDMS